MVECTEVHGLKVNSMEMEQRYYQMVQYMKATFSMVRKMVLELINGLMDQCIRVNGKIIKLTELYVIVFFNITLGNTRMG